MTLDTKALDNATATFERSWYALSEMESAGLPAELDQDARNIARIIQEHGPDYADTEHGDMTAPLLESLARLVQAAKAADRLAEMAAQRDDAADRLAELEEQLRLANIDALQTEAERNELASELRQAMDERDAAQAEARVLRERSAHVDRAATRLAIEKDTLAQELARVRGLLGAARCPNCDGSGATPHGPTPDGDWEAEQCQWCYEKQEALAAGDGE